MRFIDETLFEENKSNRDFDIPESDYNGLNDMRNQLEENDDNARTFYEDHVSLLNPSQQQISNRLRQCIDNGDGGFFFIDAPGGTGKTFLMNVVLSYVRKDNNIAIATAMSGIAATLSSLGSTFHKRFGILVPCEEFPTSNCYAI